jgi:hypothetical protein
MCTQTAIACIRAYLNINISKQTRDVIYIYTQKYIPVSTIDMTNAKILHSLKVQLRNELCMDPLASILKKTHHMTDEQLKELYRNIEARPQKKISDETRKYVTETLETLYLEDVDSYPENRLLIDEIEQMLHCNNRYGAHSYKDTDDDFNYFPPSTHSTHDIPPRGSRLLDKTSTRTPDSRSDTALAEIPDIMKIRENSFNILCGKIGTGMAMEKRWSGTMRGVNYTYKTWFDKQIDINIGQRMKLKDDSPLYYLMTLFALPSNDANQKTKVFATDNTRLAATNDPSVLIYLVPCAALSTTYSWPNNKYEENTKEEFVRSSAFVQNFRKTIGK